MTFYPDGETPIPNQTPVPDAGSPQQPDPAATQQSAARFQKAITRAAIINGVVLVVAVLLAYVFPISDDPNIAIVIIVVAALLCAVHLSVVVMREARRRQHALGTVPSTVPPTVSSQPYGAATGAQPHAPASTTGGQGQLTIEDVFTITGRGTVVTGTVTTGELWVGQKIQVIRDGQVVVSSEITGLEMFRSLTESATVGDNVGVLLRKVSRNDVQRGDVIAG